MEEYRSKSYSDGKNWQMEVYGGGRGEGGSGSLPPPPTYDMRSYSTSSAYQSSNNWQATEGKVKKEKSSGRWGLMNDPELQRRKRVASYKVYSVEGKVKGSFKKSFRWLKDRYTHVVYGWW